MIIVEMDSQSRYFLKTWLDPYHVLPFSRCFTLIPASSTQLSVSSYTHRHTHTFTTRTYVAAKKHSARPLRAERGSGLWSVWINHVEHELTSHLAALITISTIVTSRTLFSRFPRASVSRAICRHTLPLLWENQPLLRTNTSPHSHTSLLRVRRSRGLWAPAP